MARCGCAPMCNCAMTAGACTTITGSGNPDDPYKIEVLVDNASVFCTPAGLEARLFTIDTNTVDLTGDGTQANPLMADVILTPDGNVPDPDALGTGNLIKEIPGPGGGIYVSCEDVQDCVGAAVSQLTVSDCLEYIDATNTITVRLCGAPNGLECLPVGDPDCPAGGLLVTPSSDPNNGLVYGADNRLFFSSPSIVPGDCVTITGSGIPGDPFVVSPQVAPELNGLECVPGQGLLVFPSADANNGLIFGTDQRLYVNRCPYLVGVSQLLIGNGGPCFELTGDGCNTPLVATMRISDDPCNGIVCLGDGLFVEADNTAIPDRVEQTQTTPPFPGLGPFNGTGNQVVDGPTCITITNPSPCRNLTTTAALLGFSDVGRQNGAMAANFEVADNPGGPWTVVARNGQAAPTPPSRHTQNTSFSGLEVTIPPGGNRQVCTRTTVDFQGANTGRLFFSERTIRLSGRWAS